MLDLFEWCSMQKHFMFIYMKMLIKYVRFVQIAFSVVYENVDKLCEICSDSI